MSNSTLAKPFPIQFYKDEYRALEMLKEKGFNKTKFIRLAVREKLFRDFRSILKELEKEILPF